MLKIEELYYLIVAIMRLHIDNEADVWEFYLPLRFNSQDYD